MFDNLSVDFKAVGFEGSFKVADLPEATIIAGLVYGLRRMMQDSCNSAAKIARDESGVDELPEEDRKAIYDARLEQLMTGNLSAARTAKPTNGLSPEVARFLQEHRGTIKSKLDAKAYKAADAKGREAMLVAWIKEQPEAMQDRMVKAGAALIALDEEMKAKSKGLGDLFA